MLKNKNRRYFLLGGLFFFIVASLIIFSWFRYGFLYGGGDVGLPIYDPQRISEITKYIWWESAAPGFPISNSNTTLPLQVFLSFFQALGFSPVALQATLFFILLFLMGIGMFLVGSEVFGKEKPYLSILAGLFYMFNLYMMVQVWHRFIHTTFFLAAASPFFFIFFKSWIRTGKYHSLLSFLLINLLAVYLFGTFAFLITILCLMFLIYAFEILIPWKGPKFFRLISLRIFLGVVALVAIHSWWLLPVVKVAPTLLSSQHSIDGNLSTLLSISSQTVIPYSLLGINPYYLYNQADFGEIFGSAYFRTMVYLPLIFLIPGFIIALKSSKFIFWALLLVLAVFLSKGATSPFGYLYVLGFTHFFPLGVLRNPFEKLGILIPFAYAILLPLGIHWYFYMSKGRMKIIIKAFIPLLLFIILGVNLWPMWKGEMFGKYDELAFVKVPESYAQADDFIKKQSKDGKILHLPLTYGESIAYDWEYGYSGVEPSQLLFKSLPSISHGFNLNPVDDGLKALSYIFVLSDSEKSLKLLQAFNVRFIVLHKDVRWQQGQLSDPQKLETSLNELHFLERKSQYGDLIVYELKNEYFKPRVFLTDKVSYLEYSEGSIYWPWLLSSQENTVITSFEDAEKIILEHAKHTYIYSPQETIRENVLGEMPAAKHLPDNALYPLIKLKEQIEYTTLPVEKKFSYKITLAGKRLTESYLLKVKKSPKSIEPQLQEYQGLITQLIEGIRVRSKGDEGVKELSVKFILSRHLATLNLIKEIATPEEKIVVDNTTDKLTTLMKETNVVPYNQVIDNERQSDRLVFRYDLPIEGRYEILQAHQQIQHIYPGELETNQFQVNDTIKDLNGLVSENFISYGFLDLPKGLNEVSIKPIPSINLAKLEKAVSKGQVEEENDEITITSTQHDTSSLDIEVEPVSGNSEYNLIFQSWVKLGDSFSIQILQDTDAFDLVNIGEKVSSYAKEYKRDPYRNYWIENVFTFYVNPRASSVKVRLLVDPWNGCQYYQADRSICESKTGKFRYEQLSQTLFKDVKVIKYLSNPIFLKAVDLNKKGRDSIGEVSFVQKNPSSYSGKIDLKSPGFLIFNETFQPGWKLILSGVKKEPPKGFIPNLYGNAWFIDSPGEYDFKLEFDPEKRVAEGLVVSSICLLLVLGLMVKQGRKI